MRIGIDARFYGPTSKGLGRYTEQLIKGLEQYDTENTYFIFLRDENFDEYVPANERFIKVRANYPWYSFAEQLIFPFVLWRAQCDIVHFPHFNVPLFYRKKFLVTIHDLILLRYPTLRSTTLHPIFYWMKFAAYKLVIWNAIMTARYIFAVSNYTRDDIIKQYKNSDSTKIIVTYEAAYDAPMLSDQERASILARYGIIEPYILYVGNAYPHKNLNRFIHAFMSSDTAETHTLILVGKDDFFYRRLMAFVKEHGYAHRVRMLPSVSDADLTALYGEATAFVFPSLYEGFGLPPLEAMLHGCPVAVSDASCLPEIVGDAAVLFDAKDERSIAGAIDRIVRDNGLRERLICAGKERSGMFSWQRMAQEIVAIYERTEDVKRK